jgi:hypothetical protein
MEAETLFRLVVIGLASLSMAMFAFAMFAL